MEGEIVEQETRNPLAKAVNKVFGLAVGSEYLVPDILNHKIELSSGVKMELKGPKKNLDVYCRISEGKFLLMNSLAPERSLFEINESKTAGWEADDKLNKVFVPSNLILLKRDAIYGIIHEISHLWVVLDLEYCERQKRAKEVLGEKLRGGLSELTLSNNPKDKEREISAWKIIDENEKRAAEIALYILGRTKYLGFDFLPQCPDAKSLIGLVNPHLHSHQQFEQKLTLAEVEVESLISGKLPYPVLKEKIDVQISKFLLSNSPVVADK